MYFDDHTPGIFNVFLHVIYIVHNITGIVHDITGIAHDIIIIVSTSKVISTSEVIATKIISTSEVISSKVIASKIIFSSTRKRSTADPQHLCCGASGRLIFLSKAASLENHQEARQEATVIAQSLLETYRNRGFWTLQNLTSRNLIPGLLDGFSGIGMALLFYLDPQNTPDPLTLSLRD